MAEDLVQQRSKYSLDRLTQFREGIASFATPTQLDGLTIFAAGSFARLEASEYSDIDLWFTYHKSGRGIETRKSGEKEMFRQIVELAASMGFPAFSGGGRYLQTHNTDDIVQFLGGPTDDASNHFTSRMMLLLESKPVYGDDEYDLVVREMIRPYYTDFHNHKDLFQPWYLMNDIMRYWKTLLLNYENTRRNNGAEAEEQRVKNFKLKFSRMTTCFATIAALGSFQTAVTQEIVESIVKLTPRERLAVVAQNVPTAHVQIDSVLEDYVWFLQLTGKSKPALHAHFEDKEGKRTMFDRANNYGGKMFDLLARIDKENYPKDSGLLRFLVV